MTTIGSEMIQRRALSVGGSLSWVQFLKSQQVAEQVADRVWAYLVANGYGRLQREHTVRVKESERFPGTWMVRVRLHLRSVTSSRRDTAAMEAALKGAYTTADLVASYTHKLPGAK